MLGGDPGYDRLNLVSGRLDDSWCSGWVLNKVDRKIACGVSPAQDLVVEGHG